VAVLTCGLNSAFFRKKPPVDAPLYSEKPLRYSCLFPDLLIMFFPLLLLVIANCFMTLAWYGHLKFLHGAPLWQAILFGWMIALLEYSFMIPATRLLAQQGWGVGQMKITQEVLTLLVFVPFMIFLFKQPFKLDYLWAGVCLLGCIYFVFRSQ